MTVHLNNPPANATPLRVRLLAGAMLAALTVLPDAAMALPAGGVVVGGNASIASAPGQLTINQTSQSTIINWQTFGIGSGESVNFVQPGSSSVALNRVLGQDPSAILGSLTANGRVFIVNPNGILFGTTARVNVGGLVASTLGISNADFMAGNYKFSGNSGQVRNQGIINADAGVIVLMAAQVDNEGTIQAG